MLNINMETEFEVKFYPIDKDEYRKILLSIGAKCVIPERMMKIAMIDRRVYPQIDPSCDLIRVRDEGSGLIRLSAKKSARDTGKMEEQKEIDVVVSDYEKTLAILTILGYKPNRYIERLRETWNYKEAEIVIDTWPGLEPYTEIEGKSEEDVKLVATELGFDWEKRLVISAVDLFSRKYGLTIDEIIKKMENITFENNPFEGLKRND